MLRRNTRLSVSWPGLLCLVLLTSACWDSTTDSSNGRQWQGALLGGASGPMAAPTRLALLPNGQLVVSDADRGNVVVLDPVTLAAAGSFAVDGKPLGIGVRGNRIYVGNVAHHAIEVYDLKGRLRSTFPVGTVDYPTDIAVDQAAGLVFVADGASRQVKSFDLSGRFVGTIAGPGLGNTFLQAPTAVAVDPTRMEVLVSDYGPEGGPAAVKIFSYSGNYIDMISGAGNCGMLGCSNGFSRPQGLDVDRQGRIYLADALLAQVLIFDRNTKALIGTLGGRSRGLRLPLDVTIDTTGAIYATSNRTGTVELLGTGGQP